MEPHLDIEKLNDVYQSGKDSFQEFVDELSIGVGVYNDNANPVACNPSAFKLLGLSKEQFMGNSAMDPYWKVVHKDGSLFDVNDFPIIQTITTYQPIIGVIMGVTRPLQDKILLEVNAHPIKDLDGSIKYVFCTYKDVSGRF